jgi:hypothetical protein
MLFADNKYLLLKRITVCHLGFKKSRFSGPTPSNRRSYGFSPIKIIKSKRHIKKQVRVLLQLNRGTEEKSSPQIWKTEYLLKVQAWDKFWIFFTKSKTLYALGQFSKINRFFSFDFCQNFDVRTFSRWLRNHTRNQLFLEMNLNIFCKMFPLVLLYMGSLTIFLNSDYL